MLFFVCSFETLAANLALPYIPIFYKLPLLAKGSEETLEAEQDIRQTCLLQKLVCANACFILLLVALTLQFSSNLKMITC